MCCGHTTVCVSGRPPASERASERPASARPGIVISNHTWEWLVILHGKDFQRCVKWNLENYNNKGVRRERERKKQQPFCAGVKLKKTNMKGSHSMVWKFIAFKDDDKSNRTQKLFSSRTANKVQVPAFYHQAPLLFPILSDNRYKYLHCKTTWELFNFYAYIYIYITWFILNRTVAQFHSRVVST